MTAPREDQFATFGRWCLAQLRGGHLGTDIDGGEAQDAAEMIGLLVRVAVTEPCSEDCNCAEWDDFPQECLREAT